ncbi:hypothetical protein AVEN_176265-1 [Araneus ventricosus]|uniref:Uncharacterized protein n=1 Tax=Araneus ventricosus TaxID=182803 RepID=A0A4Y2PX12_ARAVE|nr:hypothetical protein AVEN_176265-1 [Araneus ventricosus]
MKEIQVSDEIIKDIFQETKILGGIRRGWLMVQVDRFNGCVWYGLGFGDGTGVGWVRGWSLRKVVDLEEGLLGLSAVDNPSVESDLYRNR